MDVQFDSHLESNDVAVSSVAEELLRRIMKNPQNIIYWSVSHEPNEWFSRVPLIWSFTTRAGNMRGEGKYYIVLPNKIKKAGGYIRMMVGRTDVADDVHFHTEHDGEPQSIRIEMEEWIQAKIQKLEEERVRRVQDESARRRDSEQRLEEERARAQAAYREMTDTSEE